MKKNKFKNTNIRTLFASTGVKGNELAPSYYIDTLIYPNSVNTAPLATIEDWLTDGSKVPTPIMSEVECDKYFETLNSKGINLKSMYDRLLTDGLEAFKVSFRDLLSKLVH